MKFKISNPHEFPPLRLRTSLRKTRSFFGNKIYSPVKKMF